MQFEWWYWTIAGFCLIGLELIFPSFTIIWLGTGALAVGFITAIWPEFPVVGQVLLWIVASIAFTLMWHKYLKPKNHRSNACMPKEEIVGETGIIIRGTEDSYSRCIVRFRSTPLLGTDDWLCRAEEIVHVGDMVKVTDIEGQVLKVTKI